MYEYADRDFNAKCCELLSELQKNGMTMPSEMVKAFVNAKS